MRSQRTRHLCGREREKQNGSPKKPLGFGACLGRLFQARSWWCRWDSTDGWFQSPCHSIHHPVCIANENEWFASPQRNRNSLRGRRLGHVHADHAVCNHRGHRARHHSTEAWKTMFLLTLYFFFPFQLLPLDAWSWGRADRRCDRTLRGDCFGSPNNCAPCRSGLAFATDDRSRARHRHHDHRDGHHRCRDHRRRGHAQPADRCRGHHGHAQSVAHGPVLFCFHSCCLIQGSIGCCSAG